MSHNHFDDKAAQWDNSSNRLKLAENIAKALQTLPLDKTMLAMDFGCGTGLVGLAVAHRVGRLVALDSSSKMIEVLRQKIADGAIANVEAICGDIEHSALPADFDVIFTSMSLHHIEDPERILAGFARLLKAGGIVAIADLDAEDGSFHAAGAEEKHHGFDRSELQQLLEKHGFSDTSFETAHTIEKTMDDGSVKPFTVFLAVARKDYTP